LSRIYLLRVAACLLLAGLLMPAAGILQAAEQKPDDALIQMITELVSDSDRDMRALGFQQVREEAPGPAATKKFAEVLSKLPPEGQAGLLEALGDRGDAAALPAVQKSIESKSQPVRAAALGALGALGGKQDVPLLAKKAAAGSDAEKNAARKSLVRMRGDGVNAAIQAAMADAKGDVHIELLGVLAARNAKEALPAVFKSAKDTDPAIRQAALGALRFLAGEKDTAAVVGLLKAAPEGPERRTAELALLTLCSRASEACSGAVIAGLDDADPASRVVLLRALARSGGAKALETIAARLKDDNEAARDQAVRMLAGWPDAAAVPHLRRLAKGDNLRHQVLAIRGLVRLAGPQGDKPADAKILAELMGLAKRPDEKRLVLGALGGVATADSLKLATSSLDDAALVEEAGLAAVMIAEKMKDADKAALRTAMEKVGKKVKNQEVCKRAQKVLKSL